MLYEVTSELVLDERAREWCKLPYPDHPKGCPNYGKKEGCPPQAPMVGDYFDLTKEHYFVVVLFDLRAHMDRMLKEHPNWSDRQAKCVLYWQAGVNKKLRKKCVLYTRMTHLTYNLCPEAMGVNVIETCQALGLPIEAKPVNLVTKVAMVGVKRPKQS